MADIEAAQARTLVSPLRTILLGVAGAVACVALAWLEVCLLQAFSFDVPVLWFVSLVALNIILLAFVAFRSDRFKRRWLAAGATTGLMFVTGVFLLLQQAVPALLDEVRSSLPIPPEIDVAGGAGPSSKPCWTCRPRHLLLRRPEARGQATWTLRSAASTRPPGSTKRRRRCRDCVRATRQRMNCTHCRQLRRPLRPRQWPAPPRHRLGPRPH